MGKPKQRYTQKHFLEYYDFADEAELVPATFHAKEKAYEKLIDRVAKDVAMGVKIDDAIRLNAGLNRNTVWKWKKAVVKEIEDGKTDTPLIRLFAPAFKADATIHRKVMSMAMKKAEEGDASTIQFLAKHRLGYGTPQTNVNVDNSENNNIQITISDMKSIERDEPIEVKGEEVEETKELE